MSRKQTVKPVRSNKKGELERKRDERAVRRAIAKDRKNRPQDNDEGAEFVSFSNQLQALGLKLREVPGDGNCLFRALGDQLEGHSRGHLRLRQETVQYMMSHRQDFEPFINGAEKQVCRELHIAYRYGDHYDSVRRIGDNSESPAQLCIEVSHRSFISRVEVYQDRTCCNALLIEILSPFPGLAEFTRPAARVWRRSEGQTEKTLANRVRNGERDPKLHQESRNPGFVNNCWPLAALRCCWLFV
ncbi:hypothetical protein GOODEAATRI_024599 [Goodea atripinnis]|uniref:ubiquitinyl hydrolase 1 n=1 Tax=Goodea atripinnis TaxID=208336 RepID=A0ABV0PGW2_9TELE